MVCVQRLAAAAARDCLRSDSPAIPKEQRRSFGWRKKTVTTFKPSSFHFIIDFLFSTCPVSPQLRFLYCLCCALLTFFSSSIVLFSSSFSFFLFYFYFTVRNGHIKRITDVDIQSSVLEIMGTNVSTNFVTCPADARKTLGIKLPFLVMIIKNLKKYFTFEVQVLDDKNVRRRFRASNYQSTTRVKPFICTMPMRLDEGWNQIQFNLSDFTRRAYGTNYIETLRVQIHANCRIRRIYFSDRLYSEEELPPEFKLFLPITKRGGEAPPQEQKDPSAQ